MKQKLDEALAEKAEIDLVNSKADSVDRTIIEALKREGEEQKEKVQILLSNDLEFAHTPNNKNIIFRNVFPTFHSTFR